MPRLPKSGGTRSIVLAILCITARAVSAEDGPGPLSVELRESYFTRLNALEQQLMRLRPGMAAESLEMDRWAAADVYRKGVCWALRYDTLFSAADRQLIEKALSAGLEVVQSLKKTGDSVKQPGRSICGYVSAVDGATQPFGLVVPSSYDPRGKPMRLDVVLHGSMRPVGLSELRFMNRFMEGQSTANSDFIELHPLGRVENCYRWAGETDVFEAIESVCRNLRIDRDRIVLRGMSMGASGTWHLGLKHPGLFVALGPYCGYVDTHRFSRTPLPNFIPVPDLDAHQESGLHMLDSVDYAANASTIPAVAAMGEKDIFFQSHVIMREVMEREGLSLVNIISPGTGHVIDPPTHAEQLRQIAGHVERGRDSKRAKIRFVTWTLKYASCHWLKLLSLQEHLQRAEFDGSWNDDGALDVNRLDNIRGFSVDPAVSNRSLTSVRILGRTIPFQPVPVTGRAYFWNDQGEWKQVADGDLRLSAGKRPALQGPIDDAFCSRFICIRGTGKPWSDEVQAWCDARLDAFVREWEQYFRGEIAIKRDDEVTNEDLANSNLVLFGDPGSNRLIASLLTTNRLPMSWTREELRIGQTVVPATSHVPLLIQPNPLTSASRYVVLNTGHTFGAAELGAVNYLLFPRLGDWAIVKADLSSIRKSDPWSFAEPGLIKTGFFDEAWGSK